MRISTVTMFQQSLSSMNRQQSEFLKVGQQIASGRRVMTPADDPQDASRAVRVSQAQIATQQNTDSRVSARNTLSQNESVLSSSSNLVISAKTLLVQAASETLNDSDRESIATELRGIYETMIGLGNSTDGNNQYLFGGYQDEAPPFVRNTDDPGIARIDYAGDEQVRRAAHRFRTVDARHQQWKDALPECRSRDELCRSGGASRPRLGVDLSRHPSALCE